MYSDTRKHIPNYPTTKITEIQKQILISQHYTPSQTVRNSETGYPGNTTRNRENHSLEPPEGTRTSGTPAERKKDTVLYSSHNLKYQQGRTFSGPSFLPPHTHFPRLSARQAQRSQNAARMIVPSPVLIATMGTRDALGGRGFNIGGYIQALRVLVVVVTGFLRCANLAFSRGVRYHSFLEV